MACEAEQSAAQVMVGGPKADEAVSRLDAIEMASHGNAIKEPIASPKPSDLFNREKWLILYKNPTC